MSRLLLECKFCGGINWQEVWHTVLRCLDCHALYCEKTKCWVASGDSNLSQVVRIRKYELEKKTELYGPTEIS